MSQPRAEPSVGQPIDAPAAEELLDVLRGRLVRHFGDQLVGRYLYGSYGALGLPSWTDLSDSPDTSASTGPQ